MVLDKKVIVRFGSKSYKWYKDKGYDLADKKEIEVLVEDLTEYSSAIVTIKCYLCDFTKKLKYYNYKYCINKTDGNYYCKSCSQKNTKNTNIEKYGTPCPLQNSLIKEKSKNSLLKKYGVDNISKAVYIREERSDIMSINTNEYNEIIRNKYGVDNISQLDWIKEKKKETTFKNWGVYNPSQNIELFEKSQKNGKKIKLHKIGLWYRGTYEKDFLDFCYFNNINVSKGLTIKYIYNEKYKYYHSDFFIKEKNLIIEIKSTYYYEKYRLINNSKKQCTIKSGYNYILILDKNYINFLDIIK